MQSEQNQYRKTILFHFWVTCPALAAMVVLPSAAGVVAFLGLIIWAASKSGLRQAQALGLQFLFMNVNGELFHTPSSGGLHHALPLVILARLVYDQRLQVQSRLSPFVISLAVVGTSLFFHSLFASLLPAVSILKVIGFTCYGIAVVLTFGTCRRDELDEISRWYKGLVGCVILLNAPLMFVSVGRSVNGTGLNGVLSHPNLLGVFLGISVAALLANALSARTLHPIGMMVIGLGLLELFFTEARGGMMSLVLSLGIWYAAVITGKSNTRAVRIVGRGLLLGVLALPAVFATSATLRQATEKFLSKSGRTSEQGLVANFRRSRGGAIDFHAKIFNRNKMFGQGFQVVNSGSRALPEVKYDPIWKTIPISASVENGFMYTSIFAELGVVGVVPVLFLFGILTMPLVRCRDNPANVLLLSVFFTNMSEAAFFSPSGIGGWEWQMVALYIASYIQLTSVVDLDEEADKLDQDTIETAADNGVPQLSF